jgi:IS5 family transposase
MYFVQHWFNLADEACEEALLDSTALRRFVGIDLGRERVPDGTTLLKFRRLLERRQGARPREIDPLRATDRAMRNHMESAR